MKTGPKTKLTKQFLKVLAENLEKGSTIKNVCASMNITEQTYYNWRRDAKESIKKSEAKEKLTVKDKLLIEFIEIEEISKAKAIRAYEDVIYEEGVVNKNWLAAKWWLEVRAAEDYNKVNKQEVDLKANIKTQQDIFTSAIEQEEKMKLLEDKGFFEN